MAYAGPALAARATPGITNYARTSNELGDIRARLTSGRRVLRIGDDSASVTAAASLQAQGATLRSAQVNGAKTTSFLQIALNGLDQIKTVLTDLSALTATANTAGRTSRELKTLDGQFQNGLTQIDTIVATTTYEGASLLDGSRSGAGVAVIPTGNLSGDSVTVDIPSVTSATLFPVATSLGTTASASTATTNVSNAQQTLVSALAVVEAYQLRLQAAGDVVDHTLGGLNSGTQNLLVADTQAESRRAELLSIRQNMSAALLAQTINLNHGLLDLLRA